MHLTVKMSNLVINFRMTYGLKASSRTETEKYCLEMVYVTEDNTKTRKIVRGNSYYDPSSPLNRPWSIKVLILVSTLVDSYIDSGRFIDCGGFFYRPWSAPGTEPCRLYV